MKTTKHKQRKQEQRRTLTVAEAAAIIGVSAPFYYKLASEDKVPALRIGARIVVLPEQIEAFLTGKWKAS